MPLRHFRNEAFLLDLDYRCGEFFAATLFANGATTPCPKRGAKEERYTKRYPNISAVKGTSDFLTQ
jgi:hypothetical protein